MKVPWHRHAVRIGLPFLAGNEAYPGPEFTLYSVQPPLEFQIGCLTSDVPRERQGEQPLPRNRAQPLRYCIEFLAFILRNQCVPIVCLCHLDRSFLDPVICVD